MRIAHIVTRNRLLVVTLLVITLVTAGSNPSSVAQDTLYLYTVSPPYDLDVTPPPDAHFEIPFWIVPGGMRQLTITTSYTYKCYTELNPLTDSVQLSASQCVLATRDYVHKGNSAAREWGRNYNGIFSQHWITVAGSDRLIAFGGGENKNEDIGGNCGRGGTCWQNTIHTDVLCSECASGYCNNHYTDCWESFSGLINLSWQYFDAEHEWGMLPHNEEGPIIWPSNGYTYGGQRSSRGVRHPHGIVDQGYIWVFYDEASYGGGSRGPGIKVARAPVESGGLPGNWKTYCDGGWVDSLPAGFSKENITSFYSEQGGCTNQMIPTPGFPGFQDSFAVAKTDQGRYFGIEERHSDDVWQIRLWQSPDLLNWSLVQTLISTSGDWFDGAFHYPVFVSADGWHNDQIEESDFYIVGTRFGVLRAVRVQRSPLITRMYLPAVLR